MRLLKSHPILRLGNGYLVDSPQPINLSYLWNFGSLLAFCLIIQIITGVTLAMHYNPSVLEAFNSVEHIYHNVFFKSSYLLESPKALSTWSINNKFILKNM
jgi:ubiquinol-cytochrome c reductase cytochrome b subunit